MNYLRKSITLLFSISLLSLNTVKVAATQVPIDIVEALMSRYSKPNLKLGIANTKFPALDLGNHVILYGSATEDSFGRKSATNFYTSKLNEEALEEKIKKLLVLHGWRIPESIVGSMQAGFKLKRQQNHYRSLLPYCHKELGTITMSVVTIKAGSFAKLSHTPHSTRSMRCGRHHQSNGAYAISVPAQLPMPELELPEQHLSNELESMQQFGISGGSSSSTRRTTATQFKSTMQISDIYQHFVPQLTQQGWSQDSSWSGSVTIGGHWMAVKDDKQYLVGITIIRGTDNISSLQMWIQKLD